MSRWTLTSFVLVALLVTGCARNQRSAARGTGGASQAAAGERNRGTSDPGSRYLDTAGPLGGIAVETAPLAGGAPLLPYRAPEASPPPVSAPAAADGELPPPLIRILPPPPLPTD